MLTLSADWARDEPAETPLAPANVNPTRVFVGFVGHRTVELYLKILEYISDQMHGNLHTHYIRHATVLLWLLLCLNIMMHYRYQCVNIFEIGAPLHQRVNAMHFKVAHLSLYETYRVKLTRWSSWPWHCLLNLDINVTKRKLFLYTRYLVMPMFHEICI